MMSNTPVFLYTCGIILLLGYYANCQPEITKFQVPAHIKEGDDATFICEYQLGKDDKLMEILWQHNGEEFFRIDENYKMVSFNHTGLEVDLEKSTNYSVYIKNFDLKSNGTFTCTVYNEDFAEDKKSTNVDIVVIPNENPQIDGTVAPSSSPGDVVSLNCTSAPSLPAASLQWTMNDKPVPEKYLKQYEPVETADNLYVSTLGIHLTLKKDHFSDHIVKFVCKSSIATLYDQSTHISHTHVTPTTKAKIEANKGYLCHSEWRLLSLMIILSVVRHYW